ncbi:glycosyltransferase 87 family protein [Hydrogenovibrio kuenenii]|uniref:glycosyltransferase 87 family protein n=1 Tax=Hydrogenovibrio kuenenii TaxID=63658 RepID=UPI0012FF1EDB|nr:glycosyltransferase 87 family protein [Hydrogenovibrio kuenenii]
MKTNEIRIYTAFYILAFCYIGYFFLSNSYLPAPFFYNRNDLFMDFFNVLRWSDDPGRYYVWGSIYPPFSFLLAKLLSVFMPVDVFSNALVYRDYAWKVFVLTLIPLVSVIFLKDFIRLSKNYRYALAIIFLSAPMLYALERGNLIIFCYFFLVIAFLNYRNNLLFSLFFALAISLKIYLIALVFVLFLMKDFWKIFLSLFFFIVVNQISATIIDAPDWYSLLSNIFSFSSGDRYYEWAYFSYSFKGLLAAAHYKMGVSTSIVATNFSQLLEIVNWTFQVLVLSIYALAVALFTYGSANQRRELAAYLSLLLLMLIMMIVSNAGGYVFVLLFVFIKLLVETKASRFLLFLAVLPTSFILVDTGNIYDTVSVLSQSEVYFGRVLYIGMVLRPVAFFLLYLVIFINFYNKVRELSLKPDRRFLAFNQV